ncbi:MAG: slipin family protein, partial [Deltaproteobacteria bacterium]|nr:slipin family protein [Deltaproteobacteria bacterium]
MKPDKQVKKTLNPISITLIIIAVVVGFGLLQFQLTHWSIAVALMVLLVVLAASIRIADQWEKAVVLRMGKYQGLSGPGFFMIIPVIDRVDDYIDQRVRVTDFTAEKTL